MVGVDNFANSSPARARAAGRAVGASPRVPKTSTCATPAHCAQVFERHAVDAVVHFAAHKAVGESVQKPLEYYRNNLGGLITVADSDAELTR